MEKTTIPTPLQLYKRTTSFESLSYGLEDLRIAFADMIVSPPGNAREYRNMATAIHSCLEEPRINPGFNQLLAEAIYIRNQKSDHHNKSSHYTSQLIRLTLQYLRRKPEYSGPIGLFPEDCTVNDWLNYFDYLSEDADAASIFSGTMAVVENQANKPKRYAGILLGLVAYSDQLPEAFEHLDIGCSAGLGQLQLAHHIGFNNVRVQGSPKVRKLIHKALSYEPTIRSNVGIDVLPNTDWEWIEACSTYPEEYRRRDQDSQRALYELYQAHRRTKEGFAIVQGDILHGDTEIGVNEARELSSHGSFDSVSAVNSLWEVSRDYTDEALRAMEGLATVVSLVQEVAQPNPRKVGSIVVADNIYASPYVLLAKDLTKPRQPYEHLGTFKSFRCDTFIPTHTLIERLAKQRLLCRSTES